MKKLLIAGLFLASTAQAQTTNPWANLATGFANGLVIGATTQDENIRQQLLAAEQIANQRQQLQIMQEANDLQRHQNAIEASQGQQRINQRYILQDQHQDRYHNH